MVGRLNIDRFQAAYDNTFDTAANEEAKAKNDIHISDLATKAKDMDGFESRSPFDNDESTNFIRDRENNSLRDKGVTETEAFGDIKQDDIPNSDKWLYSDDAINQHLKTTVPRRLMLDEEKAGNSNAVKGAEKTKETTDADKTENSYMNNIDWDIIDINDLSRERGDTSKTATLHTMSKINDMLEGTSKKNSLTYDYTVGLFVSATAKIVNDFTSLAGKEGITNEELEKYVTRHKDTLHNVVSELLSEVILLAISFGTLSTLAKVGRFGKALKYIRLLDRLSKLENIGKISKMAATGTSIASKISRYAGSLVKTTAKTGVQTYGALYLSARPEKFKEELIKKYNIVSDFNDFVENNVGSIAHSRAERALKDFGITMVAGETLRGVFVGGRGIARASWKRIAPLFARKEKGINSAVRNTSKATSSTTATEATSSTTATGAGTTQAKNNSTVLESEKSVIDMINSENSEESRKGIDIAVKHITGKPLDPINKITDVGVKRDVIREIASDSGRLKYTVIGDRTSIGKSRNLEIKNDVLFKENNNRLLYDGIGGSIDITTSNIVIRDKNLYLNTIQNMEKDKLHDLTYNLLENMSDYTAHTYQTTYSTGMSANFPSGAIKGNISRVGNNVLSDMLVLLRENEKKEVADILSTLSKNELENVVHIYTCSGMATGDAPADIGKAIMSLGELNANKMEEGIIKGAAKPTSAPAPISKTAVSENLNKSVNTVAGGEINVAQESSATTSRKRALSENSREYTWGSVLVDTVSRILGNAFVGASNVFATLPTTLFFNDVINISSAMFGALAPKTYSVSGTKFGNLTVAGAFKRFITEKIHLVKGINNSVVNSDASLLTQTIIRKAGLDAKDASIYRTGGAKSLNFIDKTLFSGINIAKDLKHIVRNAAAVANTEVFLTSIEGSTLPRNMKTFVNNLVRQEKGDLGKVETLLRFLSDPNATSKIPLGSIATELEGVGADILPKISEDIVSMLEGFRKSAITSNKSGSAFLTNFNKTGGGYIQVMNSSTIPVSTFVDMRYLSASNNLALAQDMPAGAFRQMLEGYAYMNMALIDVGTSLSLGGVIKNVTIAGKDMMKGLSVTEQKRLSTQRNVSEKREEYRRRNIKSFITMELEDGTVIPMKRLGGVGMLLGISSIFVEAVRRGGGILTNSEMKYTRAIVKNTLIGLAKYYTDMTTMPKVFETIASKDPMRIIALLLGGESREGAKRLTPLTALIDDIHKAYKDEDYIYDTKNMNLINGLFAEIGEGVPMYDGYSGERMKKNSLFLGASGALDTLQQEVLNTIHWAVGSINPVFDNQRVNKEQMEMIANNYDSQAMRDEMEKMLIAVRSGAMYEDDAKKLLEKKKVELQKQALLAVFGDV